MMGSGYFNDRNFREYSYFAEGNFAVLKLEFSVALVAKKQTTASARGW